MITCSAFETCSNSFSVVGAVVVGATVVVGAAVVVSAAVGSGETVWMDIGADVGARQSLPSAYRLSDFGRAERAAQICASKLIAPSK